MLTFAALHRKGVEANAECRYACNLALVSREGRYLGHWLSASVCLMLFGSRPETPIDERATSQWKGS